MLLGVALLYRLCSSTVILQHPSISFFDQPSWKISSNRIKVIIHIFQNFTGVYHIGQCSELRFGFCLNIMIGKSVPKYFICYLLLYSLLFESGSYYGRALWLIKDISSSAPEFKIANNHIIDSESSETHLGGCLHSIFNRNPLYPHSDQ